VSRALLSELCAAHLYRPNRCCGGRGIAMVAGMIGTGPHKSLYTAAVISAAEEPPLGELRVRRPPRCAAQVPGWDGSHLMNHQLLRRSVTEPFRASGRLLDVFND